MARTASRGFDYISLDADFVSDSKIRRLRRRTNEYAPLVYVTLLCTIFKDGGYYIKWDEDAILDFADKTHINEEFISQVVEACLEDEVGLLSGEMYRRYGILTSHGIQKQFNFMCEKSKRKSRVEEYSLLESPDSFQNNTLSKGIPSEETPIKSEENTNKSESMQQSKVKESKEKERKENKSKYSYFSSSNALALEEWEKEQQQFLSHIFFKNWAAPSNELKKFIAYNRTGGRNWDKMSHAEREAALFLWKQEPEEQKRFGEKFLALWHNVFNTLVRLNAPFEIRMDALTDGIKWAVDNNHVVIHCPERLQKFIERNMDDFKPYFRAFNRAGAYDEPHRYVFTKPYAP